jgi:hypothetical protein
MYRFCLKRVMNILTFSMKMSTIRKEKSHHSKHAKSQIMTFYLCSLSTRSFKTTTYPSLSVDFWHPKITFQTKNQYFVGVRYRPLEVAILSFSSFRFRHNIYTASCRDGYQRFRAAIFLLALWQTSKNLWIFLEIIEISEKKLDFVGLRYGPSELTLCSFFRYQCRDNIHRSSQTDF